MPSQTFTPANVVYMSKERDWAANLGMMDWDSTRIVFTKRTLIEFLKYTGTTVDPNFTNVSKLPKYATFGKLADGPANADEATTSEAAKSTPAAAPAPTEAQNSPPSDGFRPTRRVRTAPGGETHDIFGHYVDDDALSKAPPRPGQTAAAQAQESSPARARENSVAQATESQADQSVEQPAFKPTRRVRERPGGRDNISEILFGGSA